MAHFVGQHRVNLCRQKLDCRRYISMYMFSVSFDFTYKSSGQKNNTTYLPLYWSKLICLNSPLTTAVPANCGAGLFSAGILMGFFFYLEIDEEEEKENITNEIIELCNLEHDNIRENFQIDTCETTPTDRREKKLLVFQNVQSSVLVLAFEHERCHITPRAKRPRREKEKQKMKNGAQPAEMCEKMRKYRRSQRMHFGRMKNGQCK